MAFKMNGMNFGAGTGSTMNQDPSVFSKQKAPHPGRQTARGPMVKDDTLPEANENVKEVQKKPKSKLGQVIDAGKVKRKLRKAKKLRDRADELRAKKPGKTTKRVERLEKRATNKEKRAGWKEGQAGNIATGKPKKANLTDDRTGMQDLRGGKTKVYTETGKSKDATMVPKKTETPKTTPKTTYSSSRAEHADKSKSLKEFVKTDTKTGKKSLSTYDKAWDDKRFTKKDGYRVDKFGNKYEDSEAGKQKFIKASEAYWKKKNL